MLSLRSFCPVSDAVRLKTSLATALLLVLPALAIAQAREVTCYVSALDKKTEAPVEHLDARDVIVREDGVAREVLRVTKATDPMQIAVLVDNSAAATPEISNLRDALKAFVNALGTGNEISIVTYADRPTLLTSFTPDRDAALKAVDRIFAQPDSGAYLLEAISETSRGFIKREAPRPVIVVVGLEAVEFSNLGYQSVLDDVKESGAQLSVLTLQDRTPDRTQEERDRSVVIDQGTRDTGGRRETLITGMAYKDELIALADELTHQFKVIYAHPDALIPPRQVTISSARPEIEVRGVASRSAKTVGR